MVAKRAWTVFLALLLTGCAVFRGEQVYKIVLFAPFEGRYREIGYNALYAARLALSENATQTIDLLAIDDGGSVETAVARAAAIRQDSSIKGVIALGIYATDDHVQDTLGQELPILIIGHWNAETRQANVFLLSSWEFSSLLNWEGEITTIPSKGNVVSSEILSLYQVPLLVNEPARLTIYSSASLPDDDFRQRFMSGGLYVPEPNLLATLSYDATGLLIQAILTNTPIRDMNYKGINGAISFENSYWRNAPIYRYQYDETNHLVLRS
jgi:hypothetical protein